jgi:hypothetical protein
MFMLSDEYQSDWVKIKEQQGYRIERDSGVNPSRNDRKDARPGGGLPAA